MNRVEANIMRSFRMVKEDIRRLQESIRELSQKQEEIAKIASQLKSRIK